MKKARFSNMGILSNENCEAKSIDFNDQISKFAEQKVWKKRF